MSSEKRKLVCLTIKQKLELIEAVNVGVSRKELVKKYGVNLSTISRIVAQQQEIQGLADSNKNTDKKRYRKGNFEVLDKALVLWVGQMREKHAEINGLIICEQAKKLARKLKIDNFEPSNGWLFRWKSKNNISFQKYSRERIAADTIGADNWTKKILPNILQDYVAEDVYNADESVLFFKAMPNETLAANGETALDGKACNDRVTLLFLCNMLGSDKKMYAIGRSARPNCFRDKNVPFPYFSNSKAWMTRIIWTQIMSNFNKDMVRQKRSVVLFVDNAACHVMGKGIFLSNVKVVFLPFDPTSIVQPLNLGIIYAFKAQYRQQLLRKQLLSLENGKNLLEFTKEINLWAAIQMIERSWSLVTGTTIRNCFRKAGFLFEQQCSEEQLNDSTDVQEFISLPLSEEAFTDFVNCDSLVECFGEMTDDEIIDEVTSGENQECEVNEDDNTKSQLSEYSIKPTRQEAITSFFKLKEYMECNNADLKSIEDLEIQLFNLSGVELKQTNISDSFLN